MRIEIHSAGRLRYVLNVPDINISDMGREERMQWREMLIVNKHGAVLEVLKNEVSEPEVYYVLPSKINIT